MDSTYTSSGSSLSDKGLVSLIYTQTEQRLSFYETGRISSTSTSYVSWNKTTGNIYLGLPTSESAYFTQYFRYYYIAW